MQSPTRILLPLDFSERSAGAVRYGRVLASQFGAELILLHVVTPPQLEFGAVEIGGSRLGDLYRDQVGAAGRALESFHAEELSGLNVRRTVLEGDPARRIVEFSHERAADLIVMPTHGYGTFRRFILGSNTAKVLHDADCPVWTGVHLDETQVEPVPQIKTVLCGVDLGSQSSKALCWAALFAQSFGARLVLLHVTSARSGPGGRFGSELARGRAGGRRRRAAAPTAFLWGRPRISKSIPESRPRRSVPWLPG